MMEFPNVKMIEVFSAKWPGEIWMGVVVFVWFMRKEERRKNQKCCCGCLKKRRVHCVGVLHEGVLVVVWLCLRLFWFLVCFVFLPGVVVFFVLVVSLVVLEVGDGSLRADEQACWIRSDSVARWSDM